jgi:hypothetical protein
MTAVRVIGLAAACLAASPAFALDQGDYRFNGFGTLGATHLGGEDDGRSYGIQGQTNDSWRGDQLSRLGGQLSYGLTDSLDVTAQVTTRAAQDSWEANLEWFYLSYQASNELMLRAGRLRAPVYMHSESLDVGFAYPWLRLPDEVYSQVQASSYEGLDAVYTLPLSFGSATFQIAGGQALKTDFFQFDGIYDLDYERVFGGNISLATNDFGTFRAGYVEADVSIDVEPRVDTPFGPMRLSFASLDGNKAKFTSFGYQYDNGAWLTSNEWTSTVIEADGGASIDAFYLMGGRRFGDFLAHVTYAQLDGDAGRQNSWTYGLNYSLLPTVTLKGEYKRVDTRGGYSGVFIRSAQEAFDTAVGLAPARNFDGDILSVGVDFVF